MTSYVVDARDGNVLRAALDVVLPAAASLTIHMCWHDGAGHDYPPAALQAAQRLREGHAGAAGTDDQYTSLTFSPSPDDLHLFREVAPYCDLAYATGSDGETLAAVSGEGAEASVRLTPAQNAEVRTRCPQARLEAEAVRRRSAGRRRRC